MTTELMTVVVLFKNNQPKGIVTPVELFKMTNHWWDLSIDVDIPADKYQSGEINVTNIGIYVKEAISLIPRMF